MRVQAATTAATDEREARDVEAELLELEINNLENQRQLIINSPASKKVKQQKLARIDQKLADLRGA